MGTAVTVPFYFLIVWGHHYFTYIPLNKTLIIMKIVIF